MTAPTPPTSRSEGDAVHYSVEATCPKCKKRTALAWGITKEQAVKRLNRYGCSVCELKWALAVACLISAVSWAVVALILKLCK